MTADPSDAGRHRHPWWKVLVLSFLALVFAALFAWWIVHLPYRPQRLYQALPSNSVMVSEHDGLAARWQTVARNPLTTSLLQMVGIEPKAVSSVLRNRGTQDLLDRLAAKRTLLAYSPSFGMRGEPAWIFASWVGIHGQFMKWGFYNSALSSFDRIRLPGGREAWRLRPLKEWRTKDTLCLAVSDGVLVGCVSRDTNAVASLLYRVEQGGGSTPTFSGEILARLEEESWPDRGWLALPIAANSKGGPPGLNFALNLADRGRADIRLRERAVRLWGQTEPAEGAGAVTNAVAGGPDVRSAAQELAGILGGFSSAAFVAPFPETRGMLAQSSGSEYGRMAARMLEACQGNATHVALSVCAPGYSGRMKGIRVPTLAIGLRLNDPAKADELVGAWLDELNARFGLNLIRRSSPVGSNQMITIDSAVRDGLMGSLSTAERPALGVVSNWLILASNRYAIETRLAEGPRAGGADAEGAVIWPDSVGSVTSGMAAWLDIEPFAESFRLMLASYDLYGIMNGRRPEKSGVRGTLEVVSRWLQRVRPMERISLWCGSDDEETEMWLRLGAGESAR